MDAKVTVPAAVIRRLMRVGWKHMQLEPIDCKGTGNTR